LVYDLFATENITECQHFVNESFQVQLLTVQFLHSGDAPIRHWPIVGRPISINTENYGSREPPLYSR